jgi:predicted nucleic acid-binding protein
MIFLDTNIFYNFLFETELTDKAAKVFENDNPIVTSFVVVNETVYTISRKLAEKRFGVTSYRSFRDFVSSKGYDSLVDEIAKFFDLLDDFDVVVLRDYQNVFELWNIMVQYNLLPNDALIVATCRHYGIKKIATFDEDFRKVDFIEVIGFGNI